MKNLMASIILAALISVPSTAAFADEGGASAQELAQKVASLEKALAEAENAMLEMLEKDMSIINKLRAENRALKTRIEELEDAVARGGATRGGSVYDSSQRGMDKMRVENRRLSEKVNYEFDSTKADIDRTYPKGKKAAEAEKEKSAQQQDAAKAAKPSDANSSDAKQSEKSGEKKSIWDSVFPF